MTQYGPQDYLDQAHSEASALTQKVKDARGLADVARQSLDKLAALGIHVQPDDVIHEAAQMIGKGFDSVQLASLLADMPAQGGEALAQWVEQHAQAFDQKEQQLDAAHDIAVHRQGVAGLHQLMGHAVHPASPDTAGPPPGPSTSPNVLSPSSPVMGNV